MSDDLINLDPSSSSSSINEGEYLVNQETTAADIDTAPAMESAPSTLSETSTSAPKESCSKCCCHITLPPRVNDLLLWRDPKESLMIFLPKLAAIYLLFFGEHSILSIMCWVGIALLIVNFVYVNGKALLDTFQKQPIVNPHQSRIDNNITLPKEWLLESFEMTIATLEILINHIKNLFLIASNTDAVWAGFVIYSCIVFMWLFSMRWLLLLSVIFAFTLPKIYELYKVQIDEQLKKVVIVCDDLLKKITTKAPFLQRFVKKNKKVE